VKAAKTANTEIGVPRAGWHSREYSPHFDAPGTAQHVTFHLADSLPKSVLQQLEAELKLLPEAKRDLERRKRLDAYIDAGHGCCILRDPKMAKMIEASLLSFDGQRYHLLAWAVTPNHVHVLVQPSTEWSIAKIVGSRKRFTAVKICEQLEATGQSRGGRVWHREYWDRYIRDGAHLAQAIEYIHQNPVKAGLCQRAEEWQWSSAFPGNANLRIGGVRLYRVEAG